MKLRTLLNNLINPITPVNKCYVCEGTGWLTTVVSKVPLKTVTDCCKQCNSERIANPNYRTSKIK
jgi:hypothetical protein